MTAMLLLSLASTLFNCVLAAHGFDNNWTVAVTGMKDANNCVRVTSIEDLGANLVTPDTSKCLSATNMCEDNYNCEAAKASKPASFSGCTFDSSSASSATVTGVLMDGLCYDNFVVEQKNYNGAPGLAPDKVHVRSEAHLHTRSCLVVNYCATTGFYLISRASSTADYAFLAQMEAGSSAEMVFDFLIEARHPCGTTSTTMALSSAAQHWTVAAGMVLALSQSLF